MVSKKKNADKNKSRVALIIENLGMSQTKFAQALGYAAPYINRLKQGKIKPSMPVALKINTLFGYSLDYILGESEIMKDEASEILSALCKISDGYTTTPKKYADKNGKTVEGKFLLLNINEHLYDFLVAYDHATKLQQEDGLKSYDEEFRVIKQEYMKNKNETKGKNLKCDLV